MCMLLGVLVSKLYKNVYTNIYVNKYTNNTLVLRVNSRRQLSNAQLLVHFLPQKPWWDRGQVSLPRACHTPNLFIAGAEWETEKSWYCARPAQRQLNHCCVIKHCFGHRYKTQNHRRYCKENWLHHSQTWHS